MLRRTVTLCAYDKEGAIGGPVEWAADFAAFLTSAGWQTRVLILCRGGRSASSLAQRLGRIGIENEVLDSALVESLEDETEWILAQWKRRPTGYFIANLVLPAMYGARWIRQAGATTVGVIHSDPRHDRFYSDVLTTFAGGRSDLRLNSMVGVSDSIAAEIRSIARSDIRITAIPCGTRPTHERATAPKESLRLIYAGRLVQRAKRIREVVGAFLAASQIPGVTATICGDGEEREWVISALSGQSSVRYAGLVPASEMHRMFAEHQVVVLLSDFEGLPISVVEAMACGLVPVCLDSSAGVREIVNPGVNGLLVSDRGESFLTAVRSLKEPVEWKRLSLEALTTVADRYSHLVVMRRWIDLLESMNEVGELETRQIPSRVRLRAVRPRGTFDTYPSCRPSDLQLLGDRVRRSWSAFRIAVRPRARLRRAIERAKTRN